MKNKLSSAASFWLRYNPDSKLLLDDHNTMFLLLLNNVKHKPTVPFIILSSDIFHMYSNLEVQDFPAFTGRLIKLSLILPWQEKLFIFLRQSVYKYYPVVSEVASTFVWDNVMAVSLKIGSFSWIHFTISSWKSPPLQTAENFKFSQYMCTIWNQYL